MGHPDRRPGQPGILAWPDAVWQRAADDNRGTLKEPTGRLEDAAGSRFSEDVYRVVVRDLTELIVRWLPDGTLTFVNEAYCRYFGRRPDELLGSNFFPLIPEEDREIVRCQVRSLAPDRPWAAGEHRVVRGDGEERWQEWVNLGVFDGEGRLIELQSVGRDVTDRRRLENALRLSEQRYRGLFEKAPVMLHSTDVEGRLLNVSDHWLKCLGYERSEVIGRRALDFHTEASREYTGNVAVPALLQSGLLRDAPVQYKRRNGEVIDALMTSLLERGDDEKPARAVTVSIDVTERNRAWEALRDSEARYRAVFEASEDCLIIRRLCDQQALDVNPAMVQALGRTREELLRLPATGWVHPDSHVEVWKMLETVRQGKQHRFTAQAVHGDGRVVDIEGYVAPFTYRGETHTIGVGRDITERKRAVAELRDSEARYRAVFEASQDGLIIERTSDLQAVEVNPAMARMLGYTREELLAMSPTMYVHPDSLPEIRKGLDAVKRLGAHHFSVRVLRKDGRVIDVDGYITQFDYRGEDHNLVVARDVTEQKRSEREKEEAFEEIARLKRELESERDYLREEVDVSLHFGEIVGQSPALKRVLAQTEAVAMTHATVLIQGESGVGKELIAHAIHTRSPRRSRPLVRVNCASVPKDLFESEFFGHVKGSFTGAHRDREGRFQLANGGTLFLDEVAEIPLELQAKLLRVLQEGEFERIGEDKTRKTDVRVIAATNRDLKAGVRAGRFREDLYYRLSVFPIEVPPLRDRREDILPLAVHFMRLVCRDLGRKPLEFTQGQAAALQEHDWPGNARELRNVIERSVILSKGERLRLEEVLAGSAPTGAELSTPSSDPGAAPAFLTAAELKLRERENIIAALNCAGWKISGEGGAADLLGLKPTTLSYKMKAMGISRPV